MKRIIIGLLLLLACLAAAIFIAPLRAFNALVPVDRQALHVAADVAYGPDPRQTFDIYKPDAKAKNLPIIVFCFGGGWASGDKNGYGFIGRAFASRGYLTVIFNYRLVPQAVFPAFVDDTAAAIVWASRHGADFGGDPQRIFLVGHSAGAYNAAMAALDAEFLARAGASTSIIKGVAALAGPFDFLPFDDAAAIAAFSAWPDSQATQPVNFANPDAPPFLLLTGTGDRTVNPRNSRALAARLAAEHASVKLIEYDGLGHAAVMLAMARPLRWRAPVLEDIVGFFDSL
ncbi:MAG: alpha/beta hydrolase [Aestuariivirga sp.]